MKMDTEFILLSSLEEIIWIFIIFFGVNISKYEKKSTFARLGINDCLITTYLRVNFQLDHILLFNLLYFALLIILRITDTKYFQLEQTHLFHGFSRLKILQITFMNT